MSLEAVLKEARGEALLLPELVERVANDGGVSAGEARDAIIEQLEAGRLAFTQNFRVIEKSSRQK